MNQLLGKTVAANGMFPEELCALGDQRVFFFFLSEIRAMSGLG